MRSVTVEGTRFLVTLADGTVLPQDKLPGTVLTIGDGSGAAPPVRINSVETDPRDPAGEVVLYGLSQQAPDGSWTDLCEPDPDGRRLGFPLPALSRPTAATSRRPAASSSPAPAVPRASACASATSPGVTLPDGSPMEPYYQACVRMVRADYCGDGVGHTRNGTPIDLFDRIGVQRTSRRTA